MRALEPEIHSDLFPPDVAQPTRAPGLAPGTQEDEHAWIAQHIAERLYTPRAPEMARRRL